MRGKTEDRRRAIVDVAIEVFREMGFERASMAVIHRRLGGSKGTLYRYFQSKEELFEVAISVASKGPGDQVMSLLDAETDDLSATMYGFAKAYLKFITGKEVLAIQRTIISDASSSPLGRHMFEIGPGRALAKMTIFFTKLIKRGKLRDASPKMAALHFKSLVEAGFLEEALFGAKTRGDKAIREAIDIFLRAYSP